MKSERISGAEETITQLGVQESSTCLQDSGSVLMVIRSGILKHSLPVAINDVPVALNQDMKSFHFDTSEVVPEFFMRWVQGLSHALLLAWANQGATVESIDQTLLQGTLLPVPPLEEQEAIAKFLDAETSKIDALVAEQRRLIELLSEKRQAVISHAVTKGLDPNVRMKPSGIEWLGDVPEHWEVTAIRNLIRMRALGLQDGNHGALHPKSSDYLPSGIPFLMASNLREGIVDFGSCSFISEALANSLRIEPAMAGDVLLSNKGTLGEVAIVPDEIEWPFVVLTPQITYYRLLDPTKLSREFVFFYLQSFGIRHQMRVLSCHQATRPSVSLLTQREMRFVIPPYEQQVEIASFLKDECTKFDESISDVKVGIRLLQERRTALISAAVTGRIDVRAGQGAKPC